MSATTTTLLAAPRDQAAATVSASSRIYWPGVLLGLASASIVIGVIWDISWHQTIGRDTFWTPAHMAIYLGGVMGGFVGGWLAIKHTFLAGPAENDASIAILGARAPLGGWLAIWGALAMITSAPFDDWWHNAYGLDVKIISPPHVLLATGMFGVSLAALFLSLARQNRAQDGQGGSGIGLFIWAGGVFLTMGAVFTSEITFPNLQHTAQFFEVCAATFVFRLVALGRASRAPWAATRLSFVYLGIVCGMIWILPLFPAQPKLAPIFNPLTHMVPPQFPLLLFIPAIAIDVILRKFGDTQGWARKLALSVLIGTVFVGLFVVVQWNFANFMLSPYSNNWFFAGNRYWSYADRGSVWHTRFWHVTAGQSDADLFGPRALGFSCGWAILGSWIGLLWGGWMRKVRR
jgi:hypothetical protein